MSKRIILIANPAAGQDSPILGIMNRVFQESDYKWDLWLTKQAGGGHRLAVGAVQGEFRNVLVENTFHRRAFDALVVFVVDGYAEGLQYIHFPVNFDVVVLRLLQGGSRGGQHQAANQTDHRCLDNDARITRRRVHCAASS